MARSMRKVLLLKEKRSWWRQLLPAAMADTAVMVEAHLLKSPEVEAAALEATAASRRQSPMVITESRQQNLASDSPPVECRWSTSRGTSTSINKN